MAVQQTGLRPAGSETELLPIAGSKCGIEMCMAAASENCFERICCSAGEDSRHEKQLPLLSVPSAVHLPWQLLKGTSEAHPGRMPGDTSSRLVFSGSLCSGCLAQLAWNLMLRGNEILHSNLGKVPSVRGHFWKCWQRHLVLCLHFINFIPSLS